MRAGYLERGEGGPHKGMLVAVQPVVAGGAAPPVVAAVDAGGQVASFGARFRPALHLVHVAACRHCSDKSAQAPVALLSSHACHAHECAIRSCVTISVPRFIMQASPAEMDEKEQATVG